VLIGGKLCGITDVSITTDDSERLIIYTLRDCQVEEHVEMTIVEKTTTEDGAEAYNVVESKILHTVNTEHYGKSIEFVEGRNGATDKVYVAIHPKSVSFPPSELQIYIYSIDATTTDGSQKDVLKLGDLTQDDNPYPRYGINVGMIRLGPKGLLYMTDMAYGLPLVINTTENAQGNVEVLGQSGIKESELLENRGSRRSTNNLGGSFAIVFAPHAYGGESEVALDLNDGDVQAGLQYNVSVEIRNDRGKLIARKTTLEAVWKGKVKVQGGEQILEMVEEQQSCSSECVFSVNPNASSITEGDSFEFSVRVKGLEMSLGDPLKMIVKPSPTSSKTTFLNQTFYEDTVNSTITIVVFLNDHKSNSRSFESQAGEDNEDIEKFSFIDRSDNSEPIVLSSSRISAGVLAFSITSQKAGAFIYDVNYSGESVLLTPQLQVLWRPCDVEPMKSTVTSRSLPQFFVHKDYSYQNTLTIHLRDSFRNTVDGASQISGLNVTIEAWWLAKTSDYSPENMKKFLAEKIGNIYESNPDDSSQTEHPPERKAAVLSTRTGIAPNGKTYYIDNLNISLSTHSADGSISASFWVMDPFYQYAYLNISYHATPSSASASLAIDCDTCFESVGRTNNFKWYPTVQVDYKGYGKNEVAPIVGVSAAFILYTIIIFGLTWRWRNENAIKLSQKRILYGLLTSAILYYLVIFVQPFRFYSEWEYSCSVFFYAQSITGLMGITLLNLKFYRLHKIAFAPPNKKVKLTDRTIFLCTGIVGITFTLYFIVTTIAYPYVPRRKISERAFENTNSNGRETKTHYMTTRCDWEGNDHSNWLYGVTPIIFFTEFVILLILTTSNRKIPSAFSENKWVVAGVYVIFFAAFIQATFGYIYVDKEYQDPGMFRAFQIFPLMISIFVFISLLFLPKFRYVVRETIIEITDIQKHIHQKRNTLIKGQGQEIEMGSRTGVMHSKGGKVQTSFARRTTQTDLTDSTNTHGSQGSLQVGSLSSITEQTENPLTETKVKDLTMNNRLLGKENNDLKRKLKEAEREIEALKSARTAGRISSMTRKTMSTVSDSDDLPTPPEDSMWVLYRDAITGSYYYCHKKSKQVIWKKSPSW